MTGIFQPLGISIDVYDPAVKGGAKIGTLFNEVSSYAHEIFARGWYWTASISLNGRLRDMEAWYEDGLGRQIIVKDETGSEVWRGIVNEVDMVAGGLNEKRGPLFNTVNRVSAKYTPVNNTVYPPVTGSETTTIIVEDLISQANYGIFEKIISAGKCTRPTAEKIRDLYLTENTEPPRTSSVSLSPGGGSNAAIQLGCIGNINWLSTFIYEDITTGFDTIRNVLMLILAADPNNIFSTDYSKIEANSFAVPYNNGFGKTAFDIVKGLLNIGHDTNDELMNFGCTTDNQVFMSALPTEALYSHSLGDNANVVRNKTTGTIVRPWAVKPGQYLEVVDFLVGSVQSGPDLLSNKRMKFLESVKYTAPWSLDLSSGKLDKLSQILAKITYTGGEW